MLYDSTQHAREWIATEVERRLFNYVAQRTRATRRSARSCTARELWFVPVANPDGYDYTFVSPATRLWRKNLRDNDGNGTIAPGDGVDTNRNFPVKWNYDLEGASDDPADETFHGASGGSEPEVQAMRSPRVAHPAALPDRLPLVRAADPLPRGLAGRDAVHRHADLPGARRRLRPSRRARASIPRSALSSTRPTATSPTTPITRTASPHTPSSCDGGSGDPVGGTDGTDPSYKPGGFVFQDNDAAVQAEFEKNLQFALDLARSAAQPDQPSSHLGNKAAGLVPSTFTTSTGVPQTVEVNAKRSLGQVTAHWTIDGGRERQARTDEWKGGSRYGQPGLYYHRLRARIDGMRPGNTFRVWFTAGRERTAAVRVHRHEQQPAPASCWSSPRTTAVAARSRPRPRTAPRRCTAATTRRR